MITAVAYTMPALAYPTDALSPVISQETVEYHYGKHLKTYVDNLNRLIRDTDFEGLDLIEVVESAPEGPLLNNAGQVLNHQLYFEQFTAPKSTPNLPKGNIAKAISYDFGNFDEFKKQMNEASIKLFGSGWVWLALDKNGKLAILSTPNGDNPVRHGMKPLLGFDVWEHAYYIDYRNRRAEHIDRIWEIIDWKIVNERMND